MIRTDQDKITQYLNGIDQVRPILDSRYEECDSQGHKEPDVENNNCGYCFRHLRYETPRADRLRDETEGQFNASIIVEKARGEVANQKAIDKLSGLNRLIS